MTIYQVFVDYDNVSTSGMFKREVIDTLHTDGAEPEYIIVASIPNYRGNGYYTNSGIISHDRLYKDEKCGNKHQYLTDDFEDARTHHITMMQDAIKHNLETMNKAKTAVDTFEALINVANSTNSNLVGAEN